MADRSLMRVNIDRSDWPQIICRLPDPEGRGAGTWSPSGSIVFESASRIYRVSATGGEPTTVYELEEGHARHRRPFFLPDGEHFLFYATEYGEGVGSLYVGSLDGNEPKRIADGRDWGVRFARGYLFKVDEFGALLAYPFDPDRLEIVG